MSWLSKLIGSGKGATPKAAAATAKAGEPPHVIIGKHEYTPEEFAIGSFRIRPYDGDLIAKQQFDFRIAFSLGTEHHDVACRGMVVRMDRQVGLVARYQQPQPFYARKLLEYLKKTQGGR